MPETNKSKLIKGAKNLLLALPLAFIGPTVVYSAFGNRTNPWYIPILIIGLLATLASAYFMYRGIKILMRAFFDG